MPIVMMIAVTSVVATGAFQAALVMMAMIVTATANGMTENSTVSYRASSLCKGA